MPLGHECIQTEVVAAWPWIVAWTLLTLAGLMIAFVERG